MAEKINRPAGLTTGPVATTISAMLSNVPSAIVPAGVPSERHSRVRVVAGTCVRKNRTLPIATGIGNRTNAVPVAPGVMSLTSSVPAGVPSLFHSSLPLMPSSAAK